jgi:hypothetical protein
MRWNNFCLCLLIELTLIYPVCSLGIAYGMPPFSRFSYYDNYYEDQVDNPNAQGNSTVIDNLPINISSVTYLSDGNYLNATIWLSDPILAERHREYLNSSINYVMEIYDISIPQERSTGDLLYSVVVYPEEDGSWTKRIIEYEPGTAFSSEGIKVDNIEMDDMGVASKIIKTYPNVTGFFQDNDTYVAIDLALNDIDNPDDIKISLTTYAEQEEDLIYDYTHTLDAPGRYLLHLVDWPTSLEVRAGEKAAGTFLLHTIEASVPGNVTLQQNAKTANYTLEFRENRLEYPLNGTLTSDFEINVAPDAKEGVLPVEVNVTSTVTGNLIGNSWNETFYMNVLPPLSELERLGNSFNEFLVGTFALYWIPFGISSVFGYWLSRRIDRGRLPKEFLEQLRIKDILTVNASVVAGVLIFLTVGGTELFGTGALINISILTASIVYPFAISAILTLITGDPVYGIKFTIPGFVFLMVSVVLIAFLLGNPNPQNN